MKFSKKFMESFFAFLANICFTCFAAVTFAQEGQKILATSKNRNYTVNDLPAEVVELWNNFPMRLAELRQQLLQQTIADTLLEIEAISQRTSVENIVSQILNTVTKPSDAEVKKFYEANSQSFSNISFEQAKPEILKYLKKKVENQALQQYIEKLKRKYKVSIGKDVNSKNLKPDDVLVYMNNRQIDFAEFNRRHRLAIYEAEANLADIVLKHLEELIFNDLVLTEAQKLGISSSDLIASEITDKVKDFSEEENERLTEDFRKRLFAKYEVNIFFEEPEPIVQKISIEGRPIKGNPSAPVVVVMFSDFQCPACAATHPILMKILQEYGDKVCLVVRNFPLISIHKDAFLAAQAAEAAAKQGKFYEYIELLYQNQQSLGPESLKSYARDLGLDLKKFHFDMNDRQTVKVVKKDIEDGKNYGVSSTPTIFINGVKLRIISTREIKRAIEKALINSKSDI